MSVPDHSSVRLLLVGDSGVGKTCVSSFLATDKPVTTNPDWTVGCNVDVKVHNVALSTGEKPFVLELFDVGCHKKHELSRPVFYSNISGVVLVYDMSNIKSYKNLRRWVRELVHVDNHRPEGITERAMRPRRSASSRALHDGDGGSGGAGGVAPAATSAASASYRRHPSSSSVTPSGSDPPPPGQATGSRSIASSTLWGISSLPALVIGNKCDLATAATRDRLGKMVGLDLPAIEMSATQGSVSDLLTLHRFFDQVVCTRYDLPMGRSGSGSGSSGAAPAASRAYSVVSPPPAYPSSVQPQARAALFA